MDGSSHEERIENQIETPHSVRGLGLRAQVQTLGKRNVAGGENFELLQISM